MRKPAFTGMRNSPGRVFQVFVAPLRRHCQWLPFAMRANSLPLSRAASTSLRVMVLPFRVVRLRWRELVCRERAELVIVAGASAGGTSLRVGHMLGVAIGLVSVAMALE